MNNSAYNMSVHIFSNICIENDNKFLFYKTYTFLLHQIEYEHIFLTLKFITNI